MFDTSVWFRYGDPEFAGLNKVKDNQESLVSRDIMVSTIKLNSKGREGKARNTEGNVNPSPPFLCMRTHSRAHGERKI